MIDISEVKDPETREELISELTIIMHDDTGKPVQQIQAALNTLTTAELQGAWREYEDKQIAQQHERSKLLVEFDLKAGRIKGTPQNQNALLRIQAAEAAARKSFADIARQLTQEGISVSNCDTNFRLVFDSFNGSLMDIEDIRSRIASGNLVFIPGTDQELQEWENQEKAALAESVVDHLNGQLLYPIFGHTIPGEVAFAPDTRARNIERLKQLPLQRLQQIAATVEHNRQVKRQAGVRTTVQQQQTPAQQQTSALNSGSGIDRVNGVAYTPLPQVTADGQAIDGRWLLKLSGANRDSEQWMLFRAFVKKHGYQALTDRMQGRG